MLAARDVQKLQSLCAQLPANGSARHTWIRVDMTSDESVQQFADELAARNVILDGAVLMPPQDPPTSDPMPSSPKWREILQNSFVGPLALLKAAIDAMKPDPVNGKRCKIVIVSASRDGWDRFLDADVRQALRWPQILLNDADLAVVRA